MPQRNASGPLVCKSCGSELDLVGTKEASDLLGLSASSFQNVKAREDFPAPAIVLGQGALWYRDEVMSWREGRKEASIRKLMQGLDTERLSDTDQRSLERILSKMA